MEIHVHIPRAPIDEAISFFWLCRADSFDSTSITLPLACCEFVFTRSETFEVGNYSGAYNTQPYTSWFSGMHTEPVATRTHGRHISIGMMFKPWGLYQLFGTASRELINTVVKSELLAGEDLEGFLAEHGSAPGAELLVALEAFMYRRYRLRPVRDTVMNAVHAVEASLPGRGVVQRLAEELAVSSKTFIAAFADAVGLTPVQYLHLSNINRALSAISRHADVPLTEIALQHGFYDQAHFIRVFKSLCKLSPRRYKQRLAGRRILGSAPNTLLLSDAPEDIAMLQPFLLR